MNSPRESILVVDDEPQIRRLLRLSLAVQGYDVMEAGSAKEALRSATVSQPDLIVLDLGLPDMDGMEVLKALREWSRTPIFILSVRGREADKVDAFEMGADDYVTKPFTMGEFVARIKGTFRRRQSAPADQPIFEIGGLSVDLSRRIVKIDDAPVRLSPKQYKLLQVLVANAGKVVTHRQLLSELWGEDHDKDVQYLRVFVRELRGKIEADPAEPRYILTELGVGYRMLAPE